MANVGHEKGLNCGFSCRFFITDMIIIGKITIQNAMESNLNKEFFIMIFKQVRAINKK